LISKNWQTISNRRAPSPSTDRGKTSGITSPREFNPRNLTEWRQTWKKEKELARKKKFERVIGFFWYFVRQGWLRENPTATMGRVIAKHVPTDYFTADEYKRVIGATYRLGEYE
jgi:integrase/recombinase XerD